MCNKLGKKHRQYVGTEGLDRLKCQNSHWNPRKKLWDTYKVQILLTQTNLRDRIWCPQENSGINKRIKPAKLAHYMKLEKYYSAV